MDVKKFNFIKSHNFDDKLANDSTYIKDKKRHLITIDKFEFYWKRDGLKHITCKRQIKKSLELFSIQRDISDVS